MMRIDCVYAEKLIVADLDEGLDPKKKELLDYHLSQCPSCSQSREEYSLVLSSVADSVPEDPGPEFWTEHEAELMNMLENEAANQGNLTTWLRFRWKAIGALIAAVLAIIVIRMAIYTPNKEVEDYEKSRIVMEELESLYGPLAEEDILFFRNDGTLTAFSGTSRIDDLSWEWFETEDEITPILF